MWAGPAPSEAAGRLLQAPLVGVPPPLTAPAFSRVLPDSVPKFSPSLKGASHWVWGHLGNLAWAHLRPLTQFHLQRHVFPSKGPSTGSRRQDVGIALWGNTIQPAVGSAAPESWGFWNSEADPLSLGSRTLRLDCAAGPVGGTGGRGRHSAEFAPHRPRRAGAEASGPAGADEGRAV